MKIGLIIKITENKFDDMLQKALRRTSESHKNCSILNAVRFGETVKIYIKYIEDGYKNIMMIEYKVERYCGFDNIYFQRCINKCKFTK